uniref:NPH3 domain-containing protein n=1 Tax=Hordeum vulgare subsp. vulgare TaxID=112509 RepID=A0A8I7BJS4_HORVV
MTEDVDKSNLVFKIEVFLNSGVFRSWKDSIIALQSTVALLPWSEELRLVARCIDSIAAKATASPGSVVWSYTYNRKAASSDEIVEARRCSSSPPAVPRDWWVEDLCELDLELYKRVMVAVKSTGDRLPPDVVGEALRAYAARWLPESCRRGDIPADDDDACSLEVLETIVWLMPSDGDGSSPCGYSCQFLLNLVKLAVLVGAGELLREELLDRIVLQLHDASVNDLLIPAKPPAQTAYDVDLVEALVGRYTRRAGVDDIDGEDVFETNVEADGPSLPALCKLVDGYLTEVAAYPNLPVSSFVGLSTSMPESARPSHDALYTAIDVFLKMHPNLSKVEKRRISSLMDVKKLSKEASIHAAQNDRLPLRVVLQVLFFEQMRAAAAGSTSVALLLAIAGDGNAHLELDDDDGGGDCWKNRALALPEPPTPSAALRKQIGSMSLKLVGEDRRRAEVVVSDGRRSSPASRTRAAGCRCRRGRGGSSTGCGWSGSRRGRARW